MGDDLLFLVLGAVLAAVSLIGAAVSHPRRAACPPGWHHDGVRRSGAFACTPSPRGDDWPPGWAPGQLYCTNGTVPVVVDERTVACQRR